MFQPQCFYGCPHMVLYVTSRTNFQKTSSTDVLRMLKYDVLRTSRYFPLCYAKGRPLPTSCGRLLQTLWGRPHMIWYVTPMDLSYRRPEDVSHTNVTLLKWPPQHSRLMIRKEGIWIACLKFNSKTYIFFHQFFLNLFCFSSI